MRWRNARAEEFIKSKTLSVLLCVLWGALTVARAKVVFAHPALLEVSFLVYNVIICSLFLIRTRPREVSMDIVHWLVALAASFSGFFFEKSATSVGVIGDRIGAALLYGGLALSILTAVVLGRSYDFLPALRAVRVSAPYRLVRHPMYAGSLMIKFGYLLEHPCWLNLVVMAAVILLYDRRSAYEEQIMSHDDAYRAYLQRVRYRFMPGVR